MWCGALHSEKISVMGVSSSVVAWKNALRHTPYVRHVAVGADRSWRHVTLRTPPEAARSAL